MTLSWSDVLFLLVVVGRKTSHLNPMDLIVILRPIRSLSPVPCEIALSVLVISPVSNIVVDSTDVSWNFSSSPLANLP